MAFTLTRQSRLRAGTGDSGVRDGDPMHSWIPHDLAYGLNNLTYTSPYSGYAQWPPPDGISTDGLPKTGFHETGTAVEGKVFIAQVPTILPVDAHRLCWTLGFYHDATSLAHSVTIDDVFVYVSSEPYTERYRVDWVDSSGRLFDSTKMGSPFGTSVYNSLSISCSASVQVYKFVDKSAGTSGIQNWMPFMAPSTTDSTLNLVWLIVAITRHTDDGAALTNEIIRPADFSWWVQYE